MHRVRGSSYLGFRKRHQSWVLVCTRVIVQTVNELQVRKAELQKSLNEDDGSSIVVETVEVKVVLDEKQSKALEIDREKRDAAKDADEAKLARDRIDGRMYRLRNAAKRAKVADLEVLKAELEVEVKELKARKAALPGSAVFHS